MHRVARAGHARGIIGNGKHAISSIHMSEH
jgi:hypothetical protein